MKPLWRVCVALCLAGTAACAQPQAARPTAAPSVDALAGEAAADFQRGRYAQALEAFRAAEAGLPADAPPLKRAELQYQQGRALYELTRYREAIEAYQRALEAQRAAGQPGPLGATLHALGDAQSAIGDARSARRSYRDALVQRKAAGDAIGEARTSINLAQSLASNGRYVEAIGGLDAANAAMSRSDKVGPVDRAKLANSIGLVHAYIGQYDAALQSFGEAARLYRTIAGEEDGYAESLRNQAFVHLERGAYEAAFDGFQQAVNVLPPDHRIERAIGQNGAGYSLVRLGRGDRAVVPLSEAVKALREGPQTIELSRALESLGSAHVQVKLWSAAQAEYIESLQIARHWRSPDDEREALFSLGKLSLLKGETGAAIFQLKRAVNVSQQMRSRAAGLSRDGRSAFANRLSEPYKLLSRLLIDQGRVAEGEQVLLALKEVEYFEFVRGGNDGPTAAVPLTPTEKQVLDEVNALAEQLGKLFAQLQAHLNGTSPLPQAEVEALQERQAALNLRLQRALNGVDQRLKAEGADPISPRVQDSRLRRVVATLGAEPLREQAIALIYVPEERVTTVVITSKLRPIVLQLPVGWATLDPLVRELRSSIQAKGDYLPAARTLHRHLVAPVEAQLAQQQLAPDTWMLFLTDRLRYLPFAALVGADGKHVIERHRLAVLTTPALDQVTMPPLPAWSVSAFGSTQAVPGQNLGALPAAREELRAIVRSPQNPDGILPGQALLDEQFTRAAWLGIFQQGDGPTPPNTVVHVASHFKSLAGDWNRSFLVLGGGEVYNMSELGSAFDLKLDHLDLVTLSACATEINDQGSGKELEGMGVLLQKRGARAVIGTLWAIQDEGSAALMQAFYRAHGEQHRMSKAAALQAAQLDLLQGRIASSNPAVSLKHPYYWAPFLLMGNWL